jgi:hypothetical protein
MFGWGIYKVWTKNPNQDGQAFVDVATALAALVGGIVAVGFNQPPTIPATGLFSSNIGALGSFLTLRSNWNWQAALGATYAIIYVLLGIVAVGTWVAGPANPMPPLIKNLALLKVKSKGFLYVGVTLTTSTKQFENSILSNLAFSAESCVFISRSSRASRSIGDVSLLTRGEHFAATSWRLSRSANGFGRAMLPRCCRSRS